MRSTVAGPVATRLLGAIGSDVLRIDPPNLPELLIHHVDGGLDKRGAVAGLAERADAVHVLLDEADVVITGYRPGALDAFGLDWASISERHPGLSLVTLDAWGDCGPWGHERGFDSVVQAATGIAHAYGTGDGNDWTPGAMPVQALDHATGYGAAAAAIALLGRAEGPGWAHLSLARTAHELLADPRRRVDRSRSSASDATPERTTGTSRSWCRRSRRWSTATRRSRSVAQSWSGSRSRSRKTTTTITDRELELQ